MPFPAKAVIFSDEADASLAELRRRASKIALQIERKAEHFRRRLLLNAQEGEVIPLPLAASARSLEIRHGPIEKLRCLDLPDGWRMLYSFYHVGADRYVLVLEIVDHDQYSKWFPGKRKFGGTRA